MIQPSANGRENFADIPPQHADAEKALIGSMLLSDRAVDKAIEIVRAEDFYLERNRIIFEVMVRRRGDGLPCDDTTLIAEDLATSGRLEDAGGLPHILECFEAVAHPSHVDYYAGIVRDKSIRRQLGNACAEAFERSRDEAASIEDVLAEVVARINGVSDSVVKPRSQTMNEILSDVIHRINTGHARGLETGYPDLDQLTGGMSDGALIILAARPSVGKTSFAINIAENVAQRGYKVLFFSLEQTRLELVERILCGRAGISMHDVREGNLSTGQRTHLMDVAGQINDLEIVIDDNTDRNAIQIGAVARTARDVDLVIVDYLQLVQPVDRRVPREQQVAETTRLLKSVAKRLNVPLIALAQLNRQIEQREVKIPRLSDLRESGSIEQDADQVWFIDRMLPGESAPKPKEKPQQNAQQAQKRQQQQQNAEESGVEIPDAGIIVAKNRNGKRGRIDLLFDEHLTKFRSMSRRSESEYLETF